MDHPLSPTRCDWTCRLLHGTQLGADPNEVPDWLAQAYADYRTRLDDPRYPCFFGQTAERQAEMFYTSGSDAPEAVSAAMSRFVELGRQAAYARFSLAMFFAPDPAMDSHEAFLQRFWGALQRLHAADAGPMQPDDPDDPLWEFSFDGRKMFVVGTSPTYRMRRSRKLGDGMLLLFQPRELFVDPVTGQAIPAEVRRRIHARMLDYDGMPVHPDIGFYGDPGNREWKQYVLPDDNTPTTGACPFHHGGKA